MQDYFELQTSELVEKKVQQLFAPKEWPEVWAILKGYNDIFPMGESRVHLAMLKLSGGNLIKLRQSLKTANQDSRDVVASAEYPNQIMRQRKVLSEEKHREIIEKDRQQYLDWLNNTL